MDLDELRAFLAVANAGSFSGASKATGIVRSTLARRIEAMERRLDVRLILSHDHGIELTSRGQQLAELGPRVVAEARALEDMIRDRPEIATTIRCAIPPGVHHLGTAQITARVNARYPQVSWQFNTHPSPVTCLGSGEADLAIHWGRDVPNGPWVSTYLQEIPLRLVASRDYLDAHGSPESLDDLERHTLLLWKSPDFPDGHLPLLDGGMHTVDAKAASPDLLVLYEMARQNRGIALIPRLPPLPGDTWRDLAIPILPNLVGTSVRIWLVAPKTQADSEAVRIMTEESLNFLRQLSSNASSSLS